jgi:hypothetical protein
VEQKSDKTSKDPVKKKLKSPTNLLKDTWDLYKVRIKTLLGIVLVLFLAIFVIGMAALFVFGILGFFVFPDSISYLPFSEQLAIGEGNILITVTFFLLVVVLFILILVIQAWGQVALLYAIKDSDEEIGVKESFRRSRSKILSYFWLVFLNGLVVVGGFLLFVIPGIIFVVWFSLSTFVFVSEDIRGMNALLKSREYVRGRWLAVFGRFFFIGVLFLIVYAVPSYTFELLGMSSVGDIYEGISSLFINPFGVIYSFLLYKNLKSVKGEFEFTPATRTKATSIIGISGLLLIPILLGIVALVVINPSAQLSKARDAARASNQLSLKRSLEMYRIDKGKYPANLDQLIPEYLSKISEDLDSDSNYEYVQLERGESYQLCVVYENKPRECIGPSSGLDFPTQEEYKQK